MKMLTLGLLALIIAACGDPASSGSNGSIEGPYVLESGSVDGTTIAIVPGFPITMTLEAGQIGGRAACNQYGGEYGLSGTEFSISGLGWTEMGCDGDIMNSESQFLEAITRVDTLQGTAEGVTLEGEGVELVFAKEEPVPVAELTGTVWVLDSLINGDAVSSVSGARATLELFSDGSLLGSTGCRTLHGEYIVSGATVQFTTFGAEGDCPDELFDQDSHVVTVLGDGFSVEIEGDRMVVSSMGHIGLIYRADS